MTPSYIGMLRGVNVGGHKTIKMEDLRMLCSRLGFRSVQTYVQSGNIVFQTASERPTLLSKRITKAILHDFGFQVPVIVRTSEEMGRVISGNPFLKEKAIDLSKLHVTFLSGRAQADSLKRLETISSGPDRFHPGSHEIYLYCPSGYGMTKLSNSVIEKTLSVGATTRNWKTTNTLFEMASKLLN